MSFSWPPLIKRCLHPLEEYILLFEYKLLIMIIVSYFILTSCMIINIIVPMHTPFVFIFMIIYLFVYIVCRKQV